MQTIHVFLSRKVHSPFVEYIRTLVLSELFAKCFATEQMRFYRKMLFRVSLLTSVIRLFGKSMFLSVIAFGDIYSILYFSRTLPREARSIAREPSDIAM